MISTFKPKWKIFVISLRRVRARRLRVIEQMIALRDCPFEIVDAFDAKMVKSEFLTRGDNPWELADGEVAAYHSHVGIMERIVDYGLDYGIILEDDFLLGKANAFSLPSLIEIIPADSDHIQLHNIKDHITKEYTIMEPGEIFNKLSCTNVITVGYVISRRLAQFILNNHSLPRMPFDHQLIEISKKGVYNFYDTNERLIDADWNMEADIIRK